MDPSKNNSTAERLFDDLQYFICYCAFPQITCIHLRIFAVFRKASFLTAKITAEKITEPHSIPGESLPKNQRNPPEFHKFPQPNSEI